MDKNATKYTFLTPTDTLGILYLITQEVLIVSHAIIDFPDLASLSFLDFIPGREVEAFPFHNSKGNVPTENQLAKLQYQYHIPPKGYAILKNDNKAFEKFVTDYLSWYREGKNIWNSHNNFSFHLSLHHTIEFLKSIRTMKGNNFSITSQSIYDNYTKLPKGTRWQEVLLYLHTVKSIQITNVELKFPLKSKDIFTTLNMPNFNINLDILTDLKAETDVRVEWCGVQILKDNRVRINGQIIPMRTTSKQWAFLNFLVEARDKPKTYLELPTACVGEEQTKFGKEFTSSYEKRIEQLPQALNKVIKKVIPEEQIPFCIHCSPHKKDPETGLEIGEFYISEKGK